MGGGSDAVALFQPRDKLMFNIEKMAARLRELYYNNKGGAGDDPFVLAVTEWVEEMKPPVYVIPEGTDLSTLLIGGERPSQIIELMPEGRAVIDNLDQVVAVHRAVEFVRNHSKRDPVFAKGFEKGLIKDAKEIIAAIDGTKP